MSTDRRKFLRNSLMTGLGVGLAPIVLPGKDVLLETDLSDNTASPEEEDIAALNGTLTLLQLSLIHI